MLCPIMRGMNQYNEQLKAAGMKRRAKLLKLAERKTIDQLIAIEKVSRQRIQWMLKKAKEESK
jgi:hypothetical protein